MQNKSTKSIFDSNDDQITNNDMNNDVDIDYTQNPSQQKKINSKDKQKQRSIFFCCDGF